MNTSILKARLRSMIAQFPVAIVHGGKTYSGAKTSIGQDPKFAEFGLVPGCKLSVVMLLEDFAGTLPKMRDPVTVDGVEYRLISPVPDTVGISVRLNLGEKFAS